MGVFLNNLSGEWRAQDPMARNDWNADGITLEGIDWEIDESVRRATLGQSFQQLRPFLREERRKWILSMLDRGPLDEYTDPQVDEDSLILKGDQQIASIIRGLPATLLDCPHYCAAGGRWIYAYRRSLTPTTRARAEELLETIGSRPRKRPETVHVDPAYLKKTYNSLRLYIRGVLKCSEGRFSAGTCLKFFPDARGLELVGLTLEAILGEGSRTTRPSELAKKYIGTRIGLKPGQVAELFSVRTPKK